MSAIPDADIRGLRSLGTGRASRAFQPHDRRFSAERLDTGRRVQTILADFTLRRFDGKNVIVTGAAQGIGRACAQRFANEGANVMLADCAADAVCAVAEELRTQGACVDCFVADLSTSEGARGLMAATQRAFGCIDVSVHNVGGTIWAKPFVHYTDEQIEAEIQRSLWPTLWCCHAALPYMLARGAGTIVNIGSVATRGINRVPYAAAKGAVHAITTTLALETAETGIRVNCVAPGGTQVTDRTVRRPSGQPSDEDQAHINAVIEQTLRDTPLARFGTVEEQAAAVAFLASDDASYITGQTLFVAGGGIG